MMDITFDYKDWVDIYTLGICAACMKEIIADERPIPVPNVKEENWPLMSACLDKCGPLRIRPATAWLVEGESVNALTKEIDGAAVRRGPNRCEGCGQSSDCADDVEQIAYVMRHKRVLKEHWARGFRPQEDSPWWSGCMAVVELGEALDRLRKAASKADF